MRELTHEEKSFLWMLFLLSVFAVLLIIALILSQGIGSYSAVDNATQTPDYHMSPF